MIERFSKKQKSILKFVENDKRVLICDGAVRSGKTSTMVIAFIMWAMDKFNHCNFALCAKTVASAERNIVTPLIVSNGLPYRMQYRRQERVLLCSMPEKENRFYLFGGKDESSYQLIQGITLAGVLLDEVALMPRSFVDQAIARTLTFNNSKIWFNCNPEGEQHWFNQNWIIPTDKGERSDTTHLHFLMQDNPIISETEIERTKQMFTGVFYERYILGRWVLAEGLIYPMFNDGCIVDDVPKRGEYYISCDYGTLNPFSAGLWCWDGKTATRIREYYYSGRDTQRNKTDEEYYSELEALAGELDIKSVIVDPSAASFIEVIRRHHRFTVRKAKNDVIPGINTTARYLQDGTIKVHRSCKDIIREFGLYRWDEKSTEDRPIKENDHAMDDCRYFAYTILRHKAKHKEG